MENEVQPIQQPAPPPVSLSDKLKKYATQRNLIVAGIIAIVLILSFSLILFSNKKTMAPKNTLVSEISGSLGFESPEIYITPGVRQDVNIFMNTGGKPIDGVILSISYNPKLLTNVTLVQNKDQYSALANALSVAGKIENDTRSGNILVTLSLPKGASAFAGSGKIATISFTPTKTNLAVSSTPITITSASVFHTPQGTLRTNRNSLSVFFTPRPTIPTTK